jgi:hypothetical protein
LLHLDGQVHHDTHAIPMGNYVIEAGNYVIATPSELGNYMIADSVLQARRGIAQQETDAYLVRLFRQMETSFPDAIVTDWESLVDAVELPDPGDRHVIAAARAGRADVIVTDNVADFPPGALPAPLTRKSLDEFLLGSLDLYPGQVISAVHAVARRTGRSGPAMKARDIAAYLQVRGMPTFGERLLANLDQPGRT